MKLASLNEGWDGRLAIVRRDLRCYVLATGIAPTLQYALDRWQEIAPKLQHVSDRLNAGELASFPFVQGDVAPPLPRAYQWCEGSSYLVHLERTRASTGRPLPPELYLEPGVWQGTSNYFIAPHAPIPVADDSCDVDLEASVGVITDQVPMGTRAADAAQHIKLVVILNDVSLRAIQIPEMAKGLGVLQGKPMKIFSPTAITPDELGIYWTGAMLSRPVRVAVNGRQIGCALADVDCEFDFPRLIEYVSRTRVIGAGTIISCGTVANRDESRGSSCLMERRAIETLRTGSPTTPYLKFGDRVDIDCLDDKGMSLFGSMNNTVVRQAVHPNAPSKQTELTSNERTF
jgi:fumarylacetoacetate (FAA) hydrolase